MVTFYNWHHLPTHTHTHTHTLQNTQLKQTHTPKGQPVGKGAGVQGKVNRWLEARTWSGWTSVLGLLTGGGIRGSPASLERT
ncbi:rCG28499 [Rattus norvegicus]|uniref:RCG28499 n=1 Tax=Rattus norvegicus TaxID=10116 RepID=A6HVP5_RAT|nr:rCG28499 [Rattus norvegicus]